MLRRRPCQSSISDIISSRCIAWSQGKTTAQFLTPLPSTITMMSSSASSQSQNDTHSAHLRRVFELHEIGNQIQLAQTQIRNRVPSVLGLPRLYQQDEYHAVAVQLDACLNKWETALPDDWKAHNLRAITDRKLLLERYLLHLRLMHTRIFMHRPILARFYSMRSHTVATSTGGKAPSLSDRLFRECAGLCVDSAQTLASLVIDTLEAGESLGLLPWWYRIYYLHIAATTFLAAMLVPDLYTDSVAHSWNSVLSALREHQHLSAYITECICTFESMAARILEPQSSNSLGSARAPSSEDDFGLFFDDLFYDTGLDFDGFVYSTEGVVE
jgi:hypothetical protein